MINKWQTMILCCRCHWSRTPRKSDWARPASIWTSSGSTRRAKKSERFGKRRRSDIVTFPIKRRFNPTGWTRLFATFSRRGSFTSPSTRPCRTSRGYIQCQFGFNRSQTFSAVYLHRGIESWVFSRGNAFTRCLAQSFHCAGMNHVCKENYRK